MRHTIIAPVIVGFFATCGIRISEVVAANESPASAVRPNIVMILIDDLGWADAGCYGSTFYETPHIDRLAAEGMRFTNAYAACPVCSPTRASIMTGRYPARLHLTDFLVGTRKRIDSPVLPAPYVHQLPLEEVTVAEILKKAGYVTGHIGKWHLGEQGFLPPDQGFDFSIAGGGGVKGFFWPKWDKGVSIEGRFEGEYLTDRLVDEAVRFIETNRQKPFFLYLAHFAVHIPIEAKPEKIDKYKAKPKTPDGQDNPTYAAMIDSVDEGVGRVLETLQRLQLDQNTVVIYTSDNGGLSVQESAHFPNTPATCNAPLRAGKGYLYEGGIRVPWIVKWPGHVQPGSLCHTPVISNDFLPTFAEIAGVKNVETNGPLDGMSIVPLLRQSGTLQREALYWHYPHFSNQRDRPGGVVRVGDFKLIERYEEGTLELYNLADDLSERHNLAVEIPEKARELRERLHHWLKEVQANMPLPNPNYPLD